MWRVYTSAPYAQRPRENVVPPDFVRSSTVDGVVSVVCAARPTDLYNIAWMPLFTEEVNLGLWPPAANCSSAGLVMIVDECRR